MMRLLRWGGFLLTAMNLLAQTAASGPPTIGKCSVFPADNIWNTPVDTLPVDPRSAAYIANIGPTSQVRYDMTMPFVAVPGTQPKVPVIFSSPTESDPGPYPIPPTAPVEGNGVPGDQHVIVVDQDNCILYEMFKSVKQTNGSWTAVGGAVFNLNSDALRPAYWSSADAAGLPIYPGLMKYDEVASGEIRHAIRFTAPSTQRLFVWPGRHYASTNTDPNLPPMGQRFRLKASFDISGFSPRMQVILKAFKKYGLILADNGLPWFFQGVPDSRWDDNELYTLRQVIGSNLEAVDVSSLMIDPNSGAAHQPATVSVSLSPTAASLRAGQSQTFTAAVTGATSTAVTWSYSPLVGTLSNGVYTAPASITTPSTVTIKATSPVNTSQSATAVVTLLPSLSITMYPATGTVTGGGILALFVYPKTPAPAGGIPVTVTSSNPAVMPAASGTVPAGATSVRINLTAKPVVSTATALLTISAAGMGNTLQTTVLPPAPSNVALYPAATIHSNVTSQSLVYLTGPTAVATTVTVTSSNPAALKVSNSLVPAGATWGRFTVTTGVVTAATTVPIWVTTGGVTYTVVATVIP
jgi:hypothetical protein